ncbi:MAG: SGNH/GDSL hydrolase family protein [Trueperaceae bacterium]
MGYSIAKVGLAPILLAQGKYVSKTIVRLPEPEGERQGVTGEGPSLRILVLGDSAAAGVGVPTQTQALLGNLITCLAPHYTLHWKLVAKTGATSASTLRYLNKIAPESFDVVVTSLGVNDVTAGRRKDKFLEDQKAILQLLHSKFNASRVIVSGFPPVGKFPSLPQPLRWYLGLQSRRLDKALADLVKARTYCDYLKQDKIDDPKLMASDGFHPGPDIYAAWAREVANLIQKRGLYKKGIQSYQPISEFH